MLLPNSGPGHATFSNSKPHSIVSDGFGTFGAGENSRAAPPPAWVDLVHSGTPISHYYFLESGIASIVAASPEGRKAEIGLIGRDGVSPPALIMEGQGSPFQVTMQMAGHGRRVEAAALGRFLYEQPAVRPLLSHFLHLFFAQVAHTALSNAVHKIDVRLAKWILMCQDRLEGQEIAITHEYLATMLGVRRSSVTDALHILEGERLIYSSRGLVIVRNRAALETFAADAYDLLGVSGPCLVEISDRAGRASAAAR
ncbi:Crp/Fnr family transcriptional regulator [Rhizobium sp. MC63]|uniref:Crp/Fnr family transcriptional regulator n=1 Tax=Rhizobium mulingense TaxID=3031128 RepID=A0ACC6N261_9HYPH|nr:MULTISPECIES: Crp/Fnr family transcriptional regulator [unclassified Rhizobium]MDF0699330.1 Crp/Fnr family transcriptional regulator [Rhizobium sp. MC63]MEA3519648.1 Crp/Fnr family transcriptional regulator [Rhizobium sp. MJ31]